MVVSVAVLQLSHERLLDARTAAEYGTHRRLFTQRLFWHGGSPSYHGFNTKMVYFLDDLGVPPWLRKTHLHLIKRCCIPFWNTYWEAWTWGKISEKENHHVPRVSKSHDCIPGNHSGFLIPLKTLWKERCFFHHAHWASQLLQIPSKPQTIATPSLENHQVHFAHVFVRRINNSGNSDQRLWTPHRKCPSLSDVYRVMLPHTTTDIYHDVSINHTYSMINQFT